MVSSDQRHPCRWWQLFPAIFQGQLLSSQQSLRLQQRYQGSPKSELETIAFAAGAGDGDWGDGWIAMGGTVDLATLDSPILQSCCRGPRSSISPIPSGRMEFLESGRAKVNEKSRPIGKQKRRPGRGSQWGLHFPGRRSWCEPARFSARAALPRRTRPTKRNSRTLASSAPA